MANVTFNGTTKIITVNSGVTTLNVQVDLYSDWKEWALLNPGFLPAFRSVGGDELQTNYYLAPTFFLLNGWRIRPAEEDRVLTVIGNLYVDGSTDSPYIPTTGDFNVMVNSTSSNIVNIVATGSAVTPQDKTDIIEGVTDILQPDIKSILGLVHHNFRFTNQVYSSGKLTSADIKIYSNATDCDNDVNPLHTYAIEATYTGNDLNDYSMRLIS
jgi:hypothetical protein